MYNVKIYQEVLIDIQKAADWYNDQLSGLGARFQKQIVNQINSLRTNAELYSVRYKDVRCMVVKKFPFMIHFTINKVDQIVIIYAVLHTSKNPKIWNKRQGR